jgi:hypothetical protein
MDSQLKQIKLKSKADITVAEGWISPHRAQVIAVAIPAVP